MFFRLFLFELLGYNGNNGHVFTKKPDLAFWVLTAISGIKFLFFQKIFLVLKVFFGFCTFSLLFFSNLSMDNVSLHRLNFFQFYSGQKTYYPFTRIQFFPILVVTKSSIFLTNNSYHSHSTVDKALFKQKHH